MSSVDGSLSLRIPGAARPPSFFCLGTGRAILYRDREGVKADPTDCFTGGRRVGRRYYGLDSATKMEPKRVTRHSSLNDLELGLAAGGRASGRSGFGGGRYLRAVDRRFAREEQALPVFLREYAGHRLDRDRTFTRCSAEARRELDQVVADGEAMRSVVGHVEHDLAILDVLHRNPRLGIHAHGEVGRQAAIR